MTLNINTTVNLRAPGAAAVANNLNKVAVSVGNVGRAASGAQRQVRNLAGAFGAIFAARGITQVIQGLVDPAVAYQRALTKLNVLIGYNAGEMTRLKVSISSMAREMGFSPQSAAEAMISLRRTTRDADSAIRALGLSMKISQALGRELGPEKVAAEIMGPLTLKYKTPEAAFAKYDQLAAMAQEVGADMMLFTGETLNQLLNTAERTHQPLEELALSLMLMSRGGSSAAKNATQLSLAMIQLQKLSPKLRAGLGISGITVTPGAMISATEYARRIEASGVLGSLGFSRAAAKGGGESIAKILRSLQAEGLRTGESTEAVLARYHAAGRRGGTTERRAATWEATPVAAIARFQAATEALTIALGSSLMPALATIAKYMTDIGNVFGRLFSTGAGEVVSSMAVRFAGIGAAILAAKSLLWGYNKILMTTRANVESLKGSAVGAAGALANAWRSGSAAVGWRQVAGVAGTGGTLGAGAAIARGMGGAFNVIRVAAKGVVAALGGWLGILLAAASLLPEIYGWLKKMGDAELEAYKERRAHPQSFWSKAGRFLSTAGLGNVMDRAMEKELRERNTAATEAKRLEQLKNDQTVFRAEVEKAAAREALTYIQQGTTQWNEVMDRVANLAKYKPPVVDYSQLLVAKRTFRSLAKTMPNVSETGLKDVEDSMNILQTAQREGRDLSPKEWQRVRGMSAFIAMGLGRMESQGILPKGAHERFLKRYETPISEASSGKSIEAATAYTEHLYNRMGVENVGRPFMEHGLSSIEQVIVNAGRASDKSLHVFASEVPKFVAVMDTLKEAIKDNTNALDNARGSGVWTGD